MTRQRLGVHRNAGWARAWINAGERTGKHERSWDCRKDELEQERYSRRSQDRVERFPISKAIVEESTKSKSRVPCVATSLVDAISWARSVCFPPTYLGDYVTCLHYHRLIWLPIREQLRTARHLHARSYFSLVFLFPFYSFRARINISQFNAIIDTEMADSRSANSNYSMIT